MFRTILFTASVCCAGLHMSAQQTTSPQPPTNTAYTVFVTVADKEGNLPDSVAIEWNHQTRVTYNDNGKFGFIIPGNTGDVQPFTVSAPGYNAVTRTYHVSMGNTAYEVVLGKPCRCDSTKDCFLLPEYAFRFSGSQLTEEDKSFLLTAKEKLAENPECTILFTGSGEHKKQLNSMEEKLNRIRYYLEDLGISEGRIQTVLKREEQSSGQIFYSVQRK